MRPKVLVIGLDGATWELLVPWIEMGELPNLGELVRNGVSGSLRSSIPPLTFPAWKCYSTGKNPGKLGVYDMVSIDFKNKKIVSNKSTSFKAKEIWDLMSEKGIRVGIVNMPTTYPPKNVNGFMVCGPFSLGQNYTFPRELEKEIERKYGYKIIPKYYVTKNKKDVNDAIKVIKSRFDFVSDVIKEKSIDFIHLTIFFVDTLQHFLWDSEEVKRTWKFIDENIGRLVSLLDDDSYVLIMSDHGFEKTKGVLYLPKWCEEEGFVCMRSNVDFGDLLTCFKKFGITPMIIYKLLGKLRLFLKITRFVHPETLIRLRRMIPGERALEGIESKIDWNASKVIPLSSLIYLNQNIFATKDDKRYEEEIDLLKERLEGIKNPKTDENIIKKVYKKEEIYWGEHLDKAPDLIIVPERNYIVSSWVSEEVFGGGDRWRGYHKDSGVFIIYGPGVKKKRRIEGTKIIDLAPTILHIMNVPIPKDMDGRVLEEVFEEDSQLAKRPIKYRKGDEKEIIRRKIRCLKKLPGAAKSRVKHRDLCEKKKKARFL